MLPPRLGAFCRPRWGLQPSLPKGVYTVQATLNTRQAPADDPIYRRVLESWKIQFRVVEPETRELELLYLSHMLHALLPLTMERTEICFRMLELDPENVVALRALAHTLIYQADLEEGSRLYERAIALMERDGEFRTMSGLVYRGRGLEERLENMRKVVQACREAIPLVRSMERRPFIQVRQGSIEIIRRP